MSEIKKSGDYAFSQDVYNSIRAWLGDPTLSKLIYDALEAGPLTKAEMNVKLGYCNLGTREDGEWKTIFAATRRDKQPGEEGFFVVSEKNGFALMNLRAQKAQYASKPADKMEEKLAEAAQLTVEQIAAKAGVPVEQLLKMAATQAARPEIEDDGAPEAVKAILAGAKRG